MRTYNNRGEMLDHMVEAIWEQGLWIEAGTNVKHAISEMDDGYLRNVVGHLIKQAISAAHFKIFMEPGNSLFKDSYANNFEETIYMFLESHPAWKFIKAECERRFIKIYIPN